MATKVVATQVSDHSRGRHLVMAVDRRRRVAAFTQCLLVNEQT